MMAQMIMKNRKQTVNTGKMFKWDICEKVCDMSQKNRDEGHISRKYMNMSRWR